MPVRGEEEPKDVQIDNLLKANKGLAEALAEYRCLGTVEEIKRAKTKAYAWKLSYEEGVLTPEVAEAYIIQADTSPRKPKFPDTKLFKEGKEMPEQEKEEGKKTNYSLLCHKRADAMLKGKLHEFRGLENELEAVHMLIGRLYPLKELRSSQVIASIITKHIPWFRWFNKEEDTDIQRETNKLKDGEKKG